MHIHIRIKNYYVFNCTCVVYSPDNDKEKQSVGARVVVGISDDVDVDFCAVELGFIFHDCS